MPYPESRLPEATVFQTKRHAQAALAPSALSSTPRTSPSAIKKFQHQIQNRLGHNFELGGFGIGLVIGLLLALTVALLAALLITKSPAPFVDKVPSTRDNSPLRDPNAQLGAKTPIQPMAPPPVTAPTEPEPTTPKVAATPADLVDDENTKPTPKIASDGTDNNLRPSPAAEEAAAAPAIVASTKPIQPVKSAASKPQDDEASADKADSGDAVASKAKSNTANKATETVADKVAAQHAGKLADKTATTAATAAKASKPAKDPAAILEGHDPAKHDPAKKVAKADPAPAAKPSAEASGADGHKLYVQAGSYASREDAVRQRGLLILQGYNVHITEGEVNGRTVHRVRLGPFNQRRQAEVAQDELTALNMPSLLIGGQ